MTGKELGFLMVFYGTVIREPRILHFGSYHQKEKVFTLLIQSMEKSSGRDSKRLGADYKAESCCRNEFLLWMRHCHKEGRR